MGRQDATLTATLAELRDPEALLARAKGEPVAILDGTRVVAHLVPVEDAEEPGHRVATAEELRTHLRRTRARVQPVLDYLRDK